MNPETNTSRDDGGLSEDEMDSTTFLACFPPIQGAIKRDGGGNGMRIQLDIPETELANALRLQLWTNQVLEVSIRVVKGNEADEARTNSRTRPRRRVVESDSGV